ncbi:MAG: Fe2+-dependent dioxygenase [Halobacteria archaeon]|nr:Fe2+-dependent dioxygenase [Halobacteria archaeon]
MLTHIQGVLNAPQLGAARKLLDAGSFADGSRSAGMAAKRVKHNEELSLDDARHAELNNLVMGCLVKHPVYRSAAMPLKVATPYYARYTQGMSYGEHVDDPVMGEGQLYRSDISVTIFLNDPADYDGGELIITTAFGDQSIKLPAGDAVLYPSSSLHRVSEVTRGERLVAVSWIQSMVRNAEQRTLLHELNQAREALLREQPDSDETRRVNHSYINLVRMWSEV